MATIIANWKMNPPKLKDAIDILESLTQKEDEFKEKEIIICPPALYISELKNKIGNKNIKLAAQNIFSEEEGAYTGEISASMVKNIGGSGVIVGHSERRNYFNETNVDINKKMMLTFKNKLFPILCIGEDAIEKENGQTMEIIGEQLSAALKNISEKMVMNYRLFIAYEPVWAIGSGKNAEPEDVLSVNIFIKKLLIKIYGRGILKKIQILYGGSVSSKNACSYIEESGMDGFLVGGASLKSNEFIKIIDVCH